MALASERDHLRLAHRRQEREFAASPSSPQSRTNCAPSCMPAVLTPEKRPVWLGDEATDEAHVKALLALTPPSAWSAGR